MNFPNITPTHASGSAVTQEANILDYARAFTKSFSESPCNDIDILIFAQLMYARMPDCVPRLEQIPTEHNTTIPTITLRAVSAALPQSSVAFEQNFAGIAGIDETEELFRTLAVNPRFKNIGIGAYMDILDAQQETQFAAATFAIPTQQAPSTLIAVYRGTDNSFIGWKEDFAMSFQYPVPAQNYAADYLNRIAQCTEPTPRRWQRWNIWSALTRAQQRAQQLTQQPTQQRIQEQAQQRTQKQAQQRAQQKAPQLITAGHSKGGNLAVYAALHATASAQSRITHAYSLDGPGFPEEVIQSPQYALLSHKISKIVPETSIVGMIFDTPEHCTVVQSSTVGLMQHLSFSWRIDPQSYLPHVNDSASTQYHPSFLTVPDVDITSHFFNASLRHWLTQLPEAKRKQVIDHMFDVLEASGVTTFADLQQQLPQSLPQMLEAWQDITKEDRSHILEAFSLFAQSAWKQRSIL